MPAGRTFRVEVLAPAIVRWSADGWKTVRDTATLDTGMGMHVADLATATLPADARIDFTFYWPGGGRWEGVNFSVTVKREVDVPEAEPAPRA
jgi:glucoamylase